jgi:type 1 glutamine amidotransferase
MRKFLKVLMWIILSLVLVMVLLMVVFMYKVKNGFPVSYETEIPEIAFPENQPAVLLFSKSTGFRHGESIEAGKAAFEEMSARNNWFLYQTEAGGVFNEAQLAQFDIVIFNNSTGRVLNDEQQSALENYVESGGNLLGIHGAGDDSHHWAWYESNLLGAKFSHHPLNPQLQVAKVILNEVPDSLVTAGLSPTWQHTDEWYIFFENPREKGFNVIYNLDGEKIIPNGNFLWINDKTFGMGKDHPVAWYKDSGKGRTYYTSIGHHGAAWQQKDFTGLLENIVQRSAK